MKIVHTKQGNYARHQPPLKKEKGNLDKTNEFEVDIVWGALQDTMLNIKGVLLLFSLSLPAYFSQPDDLTGATYIFPRFSTYLVTIFYSNTRFINWIVSMAW